MRNFRVGSTYVSVFNFLSETYVVTSLADGFKHKVVAATILLSLAAVMLALCWLCSVCVVAKLVTRKRVLRRFRVLYVATGVCAV